MNYNEFFWIYSFARRSGRKRSKSHLNTQREWKVQTNASILTLFSFCSHMKSSVLLGDTSPILGIQYYRLAKLQMSLSLFLLTQLTDHCQMWLTFLLRLPMDMAAKESYYHAREILRVTHGECHILENLDNSIQQIELIFSWGCALLLGFLRFHDVFLLKLGNDILISPFFEIPQRLWPCCT